MRFLPRLCTVCVLALSPLLATPALSQALTVIDLKHRTVDEVLPVLQPLVGKDAALSGIDYRLLVRASDEDVTRIREALTVLDRAPKQLLVSVRYARQSEIEREHLSASGHIGTNGSQVTLRAGSDRGSRDVGNVSSVRVLEGQAAYVSSGERVPTISAGLISQRRAGAVIGEREVTSGFQVQPRINGNAVTLDVGAQQEQLRGGVIATQSVNTSVMGKLGDWLTLGGVNETTNSRSAGIGSQRIETASDQQRLWIKVELVAD